MADDIIYCRVTDNGPHSATFNSMFKTLCITRHKTKIPGLGWQMPQRIPTFILHRLTSTDSISGHNRILSCMKGKSMTHTARCKCLNLEWRVWHFFSTILDANFVPPTIVRNVRCFKCSITIVCQLHLPWITIRTLKKLITLSNSDRCKLVHIEKVLYRKCTI